MATRAERKEAYEAFRIIFQREIEAVVGRLKGDDSFTAADANREARANLKYLYINTFIAAKNGRWDTTTFSQWGFIGNRLRRQYGYLQNFLIQVASGEVNDAEINRRIKMYSGSARQMLEAGNAASRGAPLHAFPDWPGSLRTQCGSNCRCRWTIRYSGRNRIFITWRLASTEKNCSDCPKRARQWRNLEIRDGRMISPVAPIFGGVG